ncbi:ATP-dependent 6-phosphofructokinase [Geminicoccaceae bacterium 1502E]|nr:ATP-dependent 6-phosphofructokinase [Geminicoccaceae bacterium 1502E]
MRLGILTSGGDCAGLNAVIRAVTLRAVHGYGFEVYGLHEATHGLLQRPVAATLLTPDSVKGILHQGGTILRTTNRGNPFAYPGPDGSTRDRSQEIVEGYRELGLDALIGVGGDGSLAILRRLAGQGGWNLVGIPKTIDNDLGHTEQSVGFSSAVTVATEALDRLHVTAASHNRVMVLEVMGRDAGHIALTAGIAGGADVILIPEIHHAMDKVCAKIEERRRSGRNFSLVVVAESVRTDGATRTYTDAHGQARYGGIGQAIAQEIAGCTGAETRVTVLGHVQRGGSPVPLDRVIASAFGVAAVDLVAQRRFDRVVGWRARQVIDVPLDEACAAFKAVDPGDPLVRTARGLGIAFGD